MKRIARITLALALSLSVAGTLGCSSGSSQDVSDADAVEKEEEVVLTDEDLIELDEEDDEVDDEDDADEEDLLASAKQVGAEGIGFVSVPDSWVEFHDTDGNSSIQWCDGTPYTVISLNTFDLASVPEEEREGYTTEDAANSVWQNMLNGGAEEDSVQGARVTLAGRDALQVYGIYPDGSYLVTWLLQDEQGVIHYVAAEGTDETIMDAVTLVQETYHL